MLKYFSFLNLILLIAWMFVIFNFSSQNALISTEVSHGFTHRFLSAVWKEYREMTPREQERIKRKIDKPIRKTAHFTIYCILGFTAFITAWSFCIKDGSRYSALFCLLYAVSDEVHQIMTDGRACQMRDIMLDFAGSLLGIYIASLIIKKLNKKTK